MKRFAMFVLFGILAVMAGCEPEAVELENTFGDDVAFLREHTDIIVLSDAAGAAQVAVVPEYQGRVMTSTAAGADVLTTNTYSSARHNLEPLGLGDRTAELNLRAVMLARDARAAAR